MRNAQVSRDPRWGLDFLVVKKLLAKLSIDDELFAEARRLTGPEDPETVVSVALPTGPIPDA
jgi:hypothetical protein